MVRVIALAALLSGCLVETFTSGEGGTVYECVGPRGDIVEWCSLLEADELGRETGRTCGTTSRFWPRLTNGLGEGCVYSCVPHSGCNALAGCYCP